MKVREVLERIGDKPLLEVLGARGYTAYPLAVDGQESVAEFDMAAELEGRGYVVVKEDEEGKMIQYLRDLDYCVLEPGEVNIEHGFQLYRMGQREAFRQWLRDLFWDLFGRII